MPSSLNHKKPSETAEERGEITKLVSAESAGKAMREHQRAAANMLQQMSNRSMC